MHNVKTFLRMFQQLNKILDFRQKRNAVVVAIVAIFSALLETLGVSIILPFILAMLQPQQLLDYPYLKKTFDIFGIKAEGELLLFTALAIVSVYILKNGTILLFNFIQLNFRNRLERDLSVLMMESYIYKPYSFFLNINSAQIMQGVSGDISGVASVVDAYCGLLNEGLTVVFIGVLLVAINPVIAIGLIMLSAIIALFMVLALRKRIGECGAKTREAFTKRYKSAYQTVNGIKEVHVMKRQKEFLNEFETAASVACENNTEYLWIAKLPSRIIEVFFISGLIFMILISYHSVADMSVLIAQFGAMAVASIRILPSISNIANSINSLVFNRLSLENAYMNIINIGMKRQSDYIQCNGQSGEVLNKGFNIELSINNIFWKYQEDLPYVLSGLSLKVKPGEAIGLMGESGAGKSTLADIILGLFTPQKGNITVDGKNIFDSKTMWHKMIGYVPQSIFLLDDSVRNNILFGVCGEQDDDKVWAALNQAQLKEFVQGLPDGLDTILGERGIKISGGQRQRMAIARALYYNPEILILDEATSALDNETENAIIESIDALQGEKTLIIVAHRLSTIANCDRIYEIRNGGAVLKNKDEVFSNR
ncbi:protein glycosylation K [Lachnospiraceae bacterium]|nr:protein glycosylation K [Lachnospiraceae bacterium]